MSGLRSSLEEFTSEDLSALPDQRLEDDFAELQRASELLEAERLRRLAEIHRRGSFRRYGLLSIVSWLASRFGMAWSTAREQARVARALETMPRTRAAFVSGEVTSSAVRVLVDAREAHPDRFEEDETLLLEAAHVHSARDFARVVAYWRQAQDEVPDAERQRDARRLHVSATMFGMVRVDGDLDPETGETLITALRAVQDSDVHSSDRTDDRTPAQRRADALGEICRQWLDSADRPSVAGERPHVTVTVDVDALQGRADGRSELDHAGPVHPAVALRMACDASITRMILRGGSEPLDVGRRTPVIPASMRRAVVVRDRHCRFPSCDRPHAWCDAHHVVHWARGGPTALSNLVLLCRPHHRLVHAGFRLDLEDGKPVFRRPEGSILEDRAPP
jgi:hypothetical protein